MEHPKQTYPTALESAPKQTTYVAEVDHVDPNDIWVSEVSEISPENEDEVAAQIQFTLDEIPENIREQVTAGTKFTFDTVPNDHDTFDVHYVNFRLA